MFHMLLYNSKVLFFKTNQANGNLVGSKYAYTYTSTNVYAGALTVNSDKIHMLFTDFDSMESFVFTFYYGNSTFEQTYKSVNTVHFNLALKSGHLFVPGYKITDNGEILALTIFDSVNQLADRPNFVSCSDTFVELLSTDYPLQSSSSSFSNPSLTQSFGTNPVETVPIVEYNYKESEQYITEMTPVIDLTLVENIAVNLTFTKMCTDMSTNYTLVDTMLLLTGWVNLDTVNSVIAVDAHELTSTLNYDFQITEQRNFRIYTTNVTIQVLNIPTPNSGGGGSANSNRNPVSDAILIASGAIIGLNLASSGAGGGSSSSIFSMVNQFQLILLVPLLNIYIPHRLLNFIYSLNVAMFSFGFITLAKILGINRLYQYFH